ncbi:MAG: PD-(D/E)XK nuclease family protein [Candidatus Bipolaricaulota bacterium]
MDVERTLSIDEIFDEVRDYNLVLTAEASLADALNNRFSTPRIGKLAYTPKTLVYQQFPDRDLKSQKELFLDLVQETDWSWKQISYTLTNVIDFWEETGKLEGLKQLPDFESDQLGSVLTTLQTRPNLYRAMERFQIGEEQKLCTVGLYQFTKLDRSILPPNSQHLKIFTEEKESLPPFRVFSSANQLVGSVVDNILDLPEDSVGVVVHPDSPYNALLRTHLRGADINFQASRNLQDSESFKGLLQFFFLGQRNRSVKVKEAIPVLRQLGLDLPRKRDEEFLSKISSPAAEELTRLLEAMGQQTFGEIISYLADREVQIDPQIRSTLKDLQLWNERVSRSNLNDLKYYLDSFDIEQNRSSTGVLLANPGTVAYIDRPVVFYLGMTTKWDSPENDRPWKDLDRARRKNSNNFKALLQNGEKRFYMVQEQRMNRDISPSTYFNELRPDFFSFTEGEEGADYITYQRARGKREGFSSNHVSKKPPRVTAISQSSLNDLAYCPRDYFFSRVIEEPDRDYYRKGTIFHDFAEFCANFPGYVNQTGIETFVNKSLERMDSLVSKYELPKLQTEFKLGLQALKEYLDQQEISSTAQPELKGYFPSTDENFLAEAFEKELQRRFTEMEFQNTRVGVKGKVDLLIGREIVDYKTGHKKTAGKVVKQSSPDLYDGRPDFQPLIYLLHHRRVYGNRKLKFTFLYPLDDLGKLRENKVDFAALKTTINYYPWTFEDFLTKKEVFDYASTSKKRNKLLKPLGEQGLAKVLSQLDFENGDFRSKEAALSYQQQLEELCKRHLVIGQEKEHYDLTRKQLRKAARSILSTSLVELRTINYFKDDLDRFEEYLEEMLAQMNHWQETRFPVGDCDLEKVRHRDLILAGEGR